MSALDQDRLDPPLDREPSVAPLRRGLTARTVLGLQGMQAYPSVSLLVNTQPGPRLDADGAARLAALATEAIVRLGREPDPGAPAVAAVEDALSRLLEALDEDPDAAVPGPVDRSLALFFSQVHASRVDLPVDVVERSVVDPTFATRDLVRGLHRTPRHVVLVLDHAEARLYDGHAGALVPVPGIFPRTDPRSVADRPARLEFLRDVDEALGAYLRLHPAPLVIAGPEPTLSSFRWASRNTARLAGAIATTTAVTDVDDLRSRIRAVIEAYLLSRQAEALELLAKRRQERRAVLGLQDAWTAARRLNPEMLAVEQGYFVPARLTDGPGEDGGGDVVMPATDVHAPDVIDDLVDELIELVIDRGGWVALLPDGTLPDARVALTLRRS